VIELSEFDRTIRELTGEHPEARPFLCEGSPFGCDVFLVGLNPVTPTPFWPYWRLPYGCHKKEWLGDYRDYLVRSGDRGSPTRERIESIFKGVAPVRCLETNVFPYRSPNQGSLTINQRDPRVLDYLLRVLAPKVVFAHGGCAVTHFERLTGRPLPHDEFTSVTLSGIRMEIITGQHLRRVPEGWTYERFEQLGRQLRERCESCRAGGQVFEV